MHAAVRIDEVLALAGDGVPASTIARITGLPRSTVRGWLSGALPRGVAGESCGQCRGARHDFAALPAEYMYLLGVYLGDGCISAHARGVYRLRLFLDVKYPGIIEECEAAIRRLRPENKVGRRPRSGGFAGSTEGSSVELSSYARLWPCLFPQHEPGPKHGRRIALTGWQLDLLHIHAEPLLRGLIHSDGCRFINTGTNWRHPRYSFRNGSADIRRIFCAACDIVGVHWTTTPHTVYVSRKRDVARLDEFIGPKV